MKKKTKTTKGKTTVRIRLREGESLDLGALVDGLNLPCPGGDCGRGLRGLRVERKGGRTSLRRE